MSERWSAAFRAPRIEAGDDPVLGGRVEHVREPAAGHVFRHDREAIVGPAFDIARPGEPLVLESGHNRQPLAQRPFEHGELGTQNQPLEHVACLAVECEDTTPETVFVTRRRLRRFGFQSRCWHVHGAQ